MAETPVDDARRRPGDPLTRAAFWICGGFAGVILALLMAVTVVDVVGRYVFNAPLPGSWEITKVLMAALIFAALPAVSRFEQHITIDLLDAVTPARAVRARRILINLICAAALAILSWRLWVYAVQTAEFGDVTEYLRLPRAPAVFYMSVFSGLGALVLFANALRYVRGAARPVAQIIPPIGSADEAPAAAPPPRDR